MDRSKEFMDDPRLTRIGLNAYII